MKKVIEAIMRAKTKDEVRAIIRSYNAWKK
jgi:hypothetical protein